MTIWQRLNATLIVLIVLLLAGVGISFWVQGTRAGANLRGQRLSANNDRVFYDVLVMTEALRALSTDPRSETEKNRRAEAERDLRAKLRELEEDNREFPDLVSAVRSLNEFAFGSASGSLGTLQAQVLQMAENESPTATTYFAGNYPAVARQRDLAFRELEKQVGLAKYALSVKAQTASTVGLIGLAVIVLVGAIYMRLQFSAIAEPLARLVSAVEDMRQGDLTKRLVLEQKDELGKVGGGLKRIAEDLCDLVGQVQRAGAQINTTAAQIAAVTKTQHAAAQQISAGTERISATSKQMSSTSKELVKSMTEVSQVAEQTAGLAGSGQTAIARTEATARQIAEAAASVSSKLAALSEKTANINSVVSTITKVADQTNLLSLNAAIEAEKAGEYGLGFAVVAMEIRRLSDQTAVATYDIEKLLKEIQGAVSAGVFGMDKFSEELRRGAEEAREVSSHLVQIIERAQLLTPRFQLVNEGMRVQLTDAQQINETLTQLSQAAQQTAESLKQSDAVAEQLAGVAQGLQASVARFKLNSTPGPPRGNAGGA